MIVNINMSGKTYTAAIDAGAFNTGPKLYHGIAKGR